MYPAEIVCHVYFTAIWYLDPLNIFSLISPVIESNDEENHSQISDADNDTQIINPVLLSGDDSVDGDSDAQMEQNFASAVSALSNHLQGNDQPPGPDRVPALGGNNIVQSGHWLLDLDTSVDGADD